MSYALLKQHGKPRSHLKAHKNKGDKKKDKLHKESLLPCLKNRLQESRLCLDVACISIYPTGYVIPLSKSFTFILF